MSKYFQYDHQTIFIRLEDYYIDKLSNFTGYLDLDCYEHDLNRWWNLRNEKDEWFNPIPEGAKSVNPQIFFTAGDEINNI